jgi:hypothetical protein
MTRRGGGAPAGALAAGLGIAASWLAIRYLPAPFLWIFPGWFVLFMGFSIVGKSRALRLVFLNLALFTLIFVVAEAVYTVKAGPGPGGEDDPPKTSDDRVRTETTGGARSAGRRRRYADTHEILGFAPYPDNQIRRRKYDGEALLYDAVYTIDSDGLRIAPPHREDSRECVLFFGGSYTFGEGVADDETLPYALGLKTEGRYRIYNFGFHGYGPHQMLVALEQGLVESIVECRPKYVVYQAIRPHIRRAAGLRAHDRHGPRYCMGEDGNVFYDGRFDDEESAAPPIRRSAAYRLLSRSYAFKELHRGTVIHSEQIDLLAGIVDAARRFVETRWPGSEFHVVLWNERFQIKSARLERALEGKRLRIHRMSDILPGYFGDRSRYWLHELDQHPNPLAHGLVAEYLADEVLDRPHAVPGRGERQRNG